MLNIRDWIASLNGPSEVIIAEPLVVGNSLFAATVIRGCLASAYADGWYHNRNIPTWFSSNDFRWAHVFSLSSYSRLHEVGGIIRKRFHTLRATTKPIRQS